MKKNRSYSQPIIKELFAKNGMLCCNPECLANIFPNNILIGIIAHIRDLNKYTERFDEKYNEKELNNSENLIVICPNCHALIDKDSKNYSIEKLEEWKLKREKYLLNMESFNINQIFELNKQIKCFVKNIKEIHNTINDDYPKVEIKFNKKPIFYYKKIEEIIKNLEDISRNLYDSDVKIEKDAIEILDNINWNKEEYFKIEYYNNKLINRNFETLNMAIPNRLTYLSMNYKLLILELIQIKKNKDYEKVINKIKLDLKKEIETKMLVD